MRVTCLKHETSKCIKLWCNAAKEDHSLFLRSAARQRLHELVKRLAQQAMHGLKQQNGVGHARPDRVPPQHRGGKVLSLPLRCSRPERLMGRASHPAFGPRAAALSRHRPLPWLRKIRL